MSGGFHAALRALRRIDEAREVEDGVALPVLTLVVRGGPGSGKSTIAGEFRQLAERNGYDLEIEEIRT